MTNHSVRLGNMETQYRDLSEPDYQIVVDARLRVSSEIFSSILDRCKNIILDSFPSNSTSKVIHDGDKSKIISLATVFYEKMITNEDIVKMAEEVITPQSLDLEAAGAEIVIDSSGGDIVGDM